MEALTHVNKNIDVLIVGAGPSGLMMACQLAIRGIRFRIIDKKEQPISYSGALIIQARSLEIFKQMGIAQKAINNGIIADEIRVLFNGKKTFSIPIKNIGQGLSQFPYFLMLEQSKTEQLLIEFLENYGYAVESKTELLKFTQDSNVVTSILKLENRHDEILKTKYIIAADGVNSSLRQCLNIPFIGTTHPVSLFVTDCKAELNIPSNTICFSFSNNASTGLFPLKDGKWRIDGTIPKGLETNRTLKFEDIENKFAERIPMNIKLYEPNWFSVFHSHQRYAKWFQQNRCFLVGDAAHVCSPVGAQGMNTGLQDAYNLAWKLTLVIKQNAAASILNSYSTERFGIAKNIITYTDKVFNLVTSNNFLVKKFLVYIIPFILKLLLPFLQKQKNIRQFCFKKISEIGIHYRKSAFSTNATSGNFPLSSPKPGDRLPYFIYYEFGKEINFQDKIKGTGFHLFLFSKNAPLHEIIEVAEYYKGIISVEMIPYNPESKSLFYSLGIKNSGFYLIRPDSYIAYRSNKPDTNHFKNYLQQFLKVF